MTTTTTRGSRALSRLTILSRPEHSKEGEDRWAVHPGQGRIVLCDGASEGWDPGRWASVLAASLAKDGPCEEAMARARRQFASIQPAATDWLSLHSQERGSWSTVLVVTLGAQGRSLRAAAVGDTCLFVLDGFSLKDSFPVTRADDFTNSPDLVGNAASSPIRFSRYYANLGSLRRPSFALATDALAARILAAEADERSRLWRFFAETDDEGFKNWAEGEMASGRLRHDDLSLLWVR